MPSVYTISGASGTKKRKSSKQVAQQRRFKKAAKTCKGLGLKKFRACMRRELKTKK